MPAAVVLLQLELLDDTTRLNEGGYLSLVCSRLGERSQSRNTRAPRDE